VLAVAGTAGLLGVLLICVILITGGGGGRSADLLPTAAPTVTRKPKPTPTPARAARPTPAAVVLTQQERQERQAAADVVSSRGFKVVRLRDYHPQDTLRVLIGRTATGSYMAFYFVRTDYIGNDSTSTSGLLTVRSTSDVSTTLRYGIYQPGDTPGKPSGPPVDVKFTWDGVRLTPQSAVPDPSQRTPGR
jgi:hypothetical protein